MRADRTDYGAASQLAILRACPTVISRLLRKRGSVLLAAKILVISRLLHKKLSEGIAHQDKIHYIEGIRSRLAKLRQKLLNSIDTMFGSIDAVRSALVEGMCAFALATGSSAQDVLRHFHQLRAEVLVSNMRNRQISSIADSILGAMQLWIRTIQETHAIFPRQLSAALMMIKATPLFSGDDVRGIVEMDHEVHGAWIGEDIRNFTPYIRHGDLDANSVEKSLGSWAPTTLDRYLERVQVLLEDVEDYGAVVQLRKRTLDLLFTNHSDVIGIDRRQVLNSLRDAFKKRLLDIMRNRCSSLAIIGQYIRSTLQAWETDPLSVSTNLWDKSLPSLDTSHGAPVLIDALKSRLHGASSASKTVSQYFQLWLRNIQDFEQVIENIRATKWEEEDDDLYADFDEEEFSARHDLLSVKDPKALSEALKSSAKDAASKLQSELNDIIRSLDNNGTAAKAAFLLRLLRDSLTTSSTEINISLPTIYCSPNSLSHLYDVLAIHVTFSTIETCSSRITRSLARRDLPQRTLWEGTPELPVLPSSWTFRTLQAYVREMVTLGIDVWAPGAVKRVKTVMGKHLGSLISEKSRNISIEADAGQEGNGENRERETDKANVEAAEDVNTPTSKPESPVNVTKAASSKDRVIQLAFDLAYLLQAASLQTTNSSSYAAPQPLTDEPVIKNQDTETDTLRSIYETMLSDLALAPEGKKRIETSAAEYWKRTSLLFALLG